MNYFKNILMLGLFVGLIFTACRKDVIVDDMTPGVPPPVVQVEGGVFGLVKDENSNPVSNALIELNGLQFQTDSIGVFFFNHVDLNQAGALVTAEKSGYFKGSRRFYPSLGNKNYVEIKLLPKISIGSVDAAIGGRERQVMEQKLIFQPVALLMKTEILIQVK